MASKQIDTLRKLMKQVQEDRKNNKEENVRKAVQDYDDTLEKYDFMYFQIILYFIKY